MTSLNISNRTNLLVKRSRISMADHSKITKRTSATLKANMYFERQ